MVRGMLVVGFATALVAGASPAHAVTGLKFTADITLNGFGVGSSTGSARLCVTGVVANMVVPNPNTCSSVTGSAGANAFATFTMHQPAATCPLTGTATGIISGAVSGNFTWTRVGNFALISTSGGTLGNTNGHAKFVVTSPVGNPCGTPVTSTVKASAAGGVHGP